MLSMCCTLQRPALDSLETVVIVSIDDVSVLTETTGRKAESRLVDPAIEAAQQRAASKALCANVVHNLYGTQDDLPRYMRSTHSRTASSVSAGSFKSAIKVSYTPRPAWRI